MTPSGHTLPADTRRSQQMSTAHNTSRHCSSVSTVRRRRRLPSTGRPEKRLLRNLPLTIIHVDPVAHGVHVARGADSSQNSECSSRSTARRCCAMRAAPPRRQPRDLTRYEVDTEAGHSRRYVPDAYRSFQGRRR